MDACNRGEILTRSVQENAANRTAVIKTRAQVCERADRFIAHRSSDDTQLYASNFLCPYWRESDARTRAHSKAVAKSIRRL